MSANNTTETTRTDADAIIETATRAVHKVKLDELARRERQAAAHRAWYAKHKQEALDKLHARRETARAARAAKPKPERKAEQPKSGTPWHERYILKASTGYCACAVGQYCPHIPSEGEGLRSAGVRPDWTHQRREEAA